MIFRRNPLQLTLLYLSIASLWILFSDALLLALGLDRDALAHYQSLKGFLFVLAAAWPCTARWPSTGVSNTWRARR